MYSNAADYRSSRRVVLPFYDPQSNEEGVQFGMPPTTSAKEKGFRYSIVILSRKGNDTRCRRVDYPRLEHPAGELPKPIWLWANIAGEWHRVGPPSEGEESMPLEKTEGSPIQWAPEATSGPRFGRPIQAKEVQTDAPGRLSVKACGHELASAKIGDGFVQSISATQLARDMKLWTSHLIQLTQVRVAQKAPQR